MPPNPIRRRWPETGPYWFVVSVLALVSGPAVVGPGALGTFAQGPSQATANPSTVYLIVLHRPVYWRASVGDKEVELVPDREAPGPIGKPPDSWVRCGPGGKVRIINGGKSDVYEKGDWKALPRMVHPAAVQDLMKNLLRNGGATKDYSLERVISPRRSSAVWPDSLVFRWLPAPGRPVTLEIRETGFGMERLIWRSPELESKLGRYEDAQARAKLVDWRENHAGTKDDGQLSLVFTADGKEERTPFSVISKREEEALRGDLKQCEGLDPILSHLARALVYGNHKLLPESADECERALALAPDDVYLRYLAAEANRAIDNNVRARQLDASLRSEAQAEAAPPHSGRP